MKIRYLFAGKSCMMYFDVQFTIAAFDYTKGIQRSPNPTCFRRGKHFRIRNFMVVQRTQNLAVLCNVNMTNRFTCANTLVV